MRGKAFLCLLVVALLMTPVQAGDTTAMQQSTEDPKQPNANNTTMYLWANGMSAYWTHFNNNDTESVAENELMEEKDSGVITVSYTHLTLPTILLV